MITAADIKQYEEENTLWIEGTQLVDAPAAQAWEAIKSVMVRSNEVSTFGNAEQKENHAVPHASLIAQGNEVIVKAIIIKGMLSLSIKMVMCDVQPERYCRIEVTTLNQHFADVDFLIEPKSETQCHIRYRQGIHYRKNLLGWISKNITLNQREIPETVEIFNKWEQHILDKCKQE